VDVVVTIGGVIPAEGATVTLACMDPPNASGTGVANFDGTGIFNGASSKSITFSNGGPMTQTVTATLGTHAGDNYRVLALPASVAPHPSTGEPYGKSEILTVWRRLWVECDAMPYPGMPDPPSPASYLGLATSELARACVKLEIYEDNNNQPAAGGNPMHTVNDFNRILGINTTVADGRDMNIGWNDPASFWTVRIVMVSALDAFGSFSPGTNTVLIESENIKNGVIKWILHHPSGMVTLQDFTEFLILHELCHVLIDDAQTQLIYKSDNQFHTTDYLSKVVATSEIGVRNVLWRPCLPAIDSTLKEPDLWHYVQYARLLVGDIGDIQRLPRARN